VLAHTIKNKLTDGQLAHINRGNRALLTAVWHVVCVVVQAISNRNMFTHHQKTVILDAPLENVPAAAAAAGNGLAADDAEGDISGPLPAVAAPPPTLDNLGTPTGSPKHAEGATQHRHRHRSDTPLTACLLLPCLPRSHAWVDHSGSEAALW
jgi:hypothetical protein